MADPDMTGDKMLKQISQAVWNSDQFNIFLRLILPQLTIAIL